MVRAYPLLTLVFSFMPVLFLACAEVLLQDGPSSALRAFWPRRAADGPWHQIVVLGLLGHGEVRYRALIGFLHTFFEGTFRWSHHNHSTDV